MKRSSEPSVSSFRTALRWLPPVLLVAAILLALKNRPEEARREEAVPPAASRKTEREPSPAPRRVLPLPAEEDPAAAVAAAAQALPPVFPSGHEGHGDECAECLAARRLAACREDYAQLCYTQLAEAYVIGGEMSPRVLEACRRFAASVLKEWSFSESKPLLPPDEIVEARRREFVSPLLAGLAAKQEDTR